MYAITAEIPDCPEMVSESAQCVCHTAEHSASTGSRWNFDALLGGLIDVDEVLQRVGKQVQRLFDIVNQLRAEGVTAFIVERGTKGFNIVCSLLSQSWSLWL